jgi:glutamate synthase (NADPH/NADH) large chain
MTRMMRSACLKQLISNTCALPTPSRARLILDDWQDFMLPKFVKVMPVDYRRALKEMQAQPPADGDMPRIGVREGN